MQEIEVPGYEFSEEIRVDLAKTALIVVDMQNDFVKEGGSLVVPDAEATIPNIKGLLDLARGSGMKVVYSQDTHDEGDPEWEIWPEHVRIGSWGWQSSTNSSRARAKSSSARSATTPSMAHTWIISCASGA